VLISSIVQRVCASWAICSMSMLADTTAYYGLPIGTDCMMEMGIFHARTGAHSAPAHTQCVATCTNNNSTDSERWQGMFREGTPAHGQAVCFPGNGNPDDGDREVQVPHLSKRQT
jgi:hypothetical protein